jgi:tetratricopeptide (TPR) repeat protein
MATLSQSFRQAVFRYAANRAARITNPRKAARWLRLACRTAPRFDRVHRDLIAYYRTTGDRLAAVAAAHETVTRFGEVPDAWMLLGECYQAAYRPRDALAAFEEVLVIEERADAAMAAGEAYSQAGDHVTAGARYARAYAAGAGPRALLLNALELEAAGDAKAAAEARTLWERETGKRWVAEEGRIGAPPT